ncbi:hypothetical protein [Nitratireductor sp. ZSWI3]|uniref:hypothetical protein n=1 Tax=Nitratireductor sp. ZSWI3 TaxID=2966359 RepID=UPI00215001FC|nr:hypothetical protein [Nitratireductor sp. ZSWI3]MCR4267758.1 hypothetical protein [Nitratireductor sp. ZSWI3]
MKLILVAMLGLSVAACSSTSDGSGSNVSASSGKAATRYAQRKTVAMAEDSCAQARRSQEGAAVMGALLGAVGDYAPYSSRNGWAVNRAAYAGRRMAGVAESTNAREADRRC